MINFAAPALGPRHVESASPFRLKTAISGLAGVESTRSFSSMVCQVTAIFPGRRNLYFMRQQITEKLAQAKPKFALGPWRTQNLDLYPKALARIVLYSIEYAEPGGDGNDYCDWPKPGLKMSDGSYLTDDGETLPDRRGSTSDLSPDGARLVLRPTAKDSSGCSRH